jgi:hypothetical protein
MGRRTLILALGLFVVGGGAVRTSKATQLAVVRTSDGLIIGANTWSGLAANGKIQDGPPICKIHIAGSFVALNIGSAGTHIYTNSATRHSDIVVGDIEAAIHGALKRNQSFDVNRQAIVRSVKAELTKALEAKEGIGETPAALLKEGKDVGIILGEVKSASMVRSDVFRVRLTSMSPVTFKVIDLFADATNARGNGVSWFQQTPIAVTLNPDAESVARMMQIRVDQAPGPEYKVKLQPPFVIAEFRSDGIHWLKNGQACMGR